MLVTDASSTTATYSRDKLLTLDSKATINTEKDYGKVKMQKVEALARKKRMDSVYKASIISSNPTLSSPQIVSQTKVSSLTRTKGGEFFK